MPRRWTSTVHYTSISQFETQAAIGRRTLTIAESWRKPLIDWRYEDEAKAVQLVNPQWQTLPIYMVPNAASSLLTTVKDYTKFLTHLVAGSSGNGLKLAPATW